MAKPKPEFPKDTTIKLSQNFKQFLIAEKLTPGETMEDVIKRKLKNSEVDI